VMLDRRSFFFRSILKVNFRTSACIDYVVLQIKTNEMK